MPSARPLPRDVLAFQLAGVLEQVDTDVARLGLDPYARTLLISARDYLEQIRSLSEQLELPPTAQVALTDGLRSLLREVGDKGDADKIVLLAGEVRAVLQNIRDLCIAVLSENERQTHAGWTLNNN